MDRWKGKVAVVTGASSGIGLEICKALVKEGMIVVGLARRKEKMINEMAATTGPGKFHAIQCDVSKESDVIAALNHVEKHFKELNVLINNAGIVKIKNIQQAETEELEEVIGVNLMGTLYCYKHGVALMKKNGGEGYIINMNSVAGHAVPNPSLLSDVHTNVYAPSKYALRALSDVMVFELLAERRIRVTNLSPGYVLTDIFGIPDTNLEQLTQNFAALKSEDIASTVVYLIGTPSHVQITQLTIKPLGEIF